MMHLKPKTVGIMVNPQNPAAIRAAGKLASFLQRKAKVLCQEHVTHKAEGNRVACDEETICTKSDLIVVLGGDGSILHAARCAGKKQTPLLGVNLGTLGFLTDIQLNEARKSIDRVMSGMARLEERSVLSAQVTKPTGEHTRLSALNEVVITRRGYARLIQLRVCIDDEYAITYRADGLIVATPTGSTAHALSSGGPIVNPALNVHILSPICPHTLSQRPLLVSSKSSIDVEIIPSRTDASVTADGQVSVSAAEGDHILFSSAPYKVRLVRTTNVTYYHLLRQKLGWRG